MPIHRVFLSGWIDGENEEMAVTFFNEIVARVCGLNGLTVNGAYVTAPGGQLQSFTCPAPQHYVTSDGASQGWACYEETTGVWLLNALPPAQSQSAPVPVPSPQQPSVIYQPAPPVVYQTPTVIYQQPPTVVYQAPPTVVYTAPVVIAPAYPPSVILGTAAI